MLEEDCNDGRRHFHVLVSRDRPQQWYTALIATNLGWLFDGFETYALVLTGAGRSSCSQSIVNAFFCQGLFSWMPAWLVPDLRAPAIAFGFQYARFIAFLGPLLPGC